jgi:hypothetical protein
VGVHKHIERKRATKRNGERGERDRETETDRDTERDIERGKSLHRDSCSAGSCRG